MKPAILILVILLSAAVVLYAGGLDYLKSLAQPAAPSRLMGTIVTDEVLISAKAGGRLQTLMVDEGSFVEPDQVVARLDRVELEAEREIQLARIAQVESKVKRSEEVVSVERDRARRRTERALAGLSVTRSQCQQKQAELDQREKDLDRTQDLFRRGLVAREELEQSETAVKVTEAGLRALTEGVAESEAQVELALADEMQGKVLAKDVEQNQGELLQTRATLKQIEARLAETEIRSPIRGIVSRRISRAGEVVQPGAPIVIVVDPDVIWIKAAVEESSVHQFVVGGAVAVEVPGLGAMEGRVTFLAPVAEFATQRDVSRARRDIRTFTIKIAVPNPERRLHAGMSAYVLVPHPSGEAGTKATRSGSSPVALPAGEDRSESSNPTAGALPRPGTGQR